MNDAIKFGLEVGIALFFVVFGVVATIGRNIPLAEVSGVVAFLVGGAIAYGVGSAISSIH